jgi:hypothetical protein
MDMKIKFIGLDKVLKDLKDKERQIIKLASASINRTASHVRAQIVKMGREEYTMKASSLRDAISIEKVSGSKGLQAIVSVKRQVIPLTEFKTKGGNRRIAVGEPVITKAKRRRRRITPIAVMVKKATGYLPLPGAFRGKSRRGPTIYIRKTQARYPLKPLSGPSPGGIVGQTVNLEKIRSSAQAYLQRELEGALKYGLK